MMHVLIDVFLVLQLQTHGFVHCTDMQWTLVAGFFL